MLQSLPCFQIGWFLLGLRPYRCMGSRLAEMIAPIADNHSDPTSTIRLNLSQCMLHWQLETWQHNLAWIVFGNKLSVIYIKSAVPSWKLVSLIVNTKQTCLIYVELCGRLFNGSIQNFTITFGVRFHGYDLSLHTLKMFWRVFSSIRSSVDTTAVVFPCTYTRIKKPRWMNIPYIVNTIIITSKC